MSDRLGEGRTVIPDTLLRRGDRTLLVEFAVSHFCGPEKLAELRRRRLPTVEVDLSQIPRHATREEHAAMIAEAPRRWLFNGLQEEAMDRLRLRAKRRYSAEARRVQSGLVSPRGVGDETFVRRITDAGMGDAIGLPVEGASCFSVVDRTWQATVLAALVLQGPHQRSSAQHLLRVVLEGECMLKKWLGGSVYWDPDFVEHCRALIVGFRMPADVVADYCEQLVARGILWREPSGWRAVEEVAATAAATLQAETDRRVRLQEVRRLIGTVLARIQERRTMNPDRWMQAHIPEFGDTPIGVAMRGGDAYQALTGRLKKLADMTFQGGPDLPREQHLGLPLAIEAAARLAERRSREAARNMTDEAAAQQAAERRRADTAKFLVEALQEATTELGEGKGRAELVRVLAEAGVPIEGGVLPVELEWGARRKVEAALNQARWERQAAAEVEARCREAEEVRLAAIARCRGDLEAAALAHFRREAGFRDPNQLAQMWLRGTQPTLGASPWDYTTDRPRLVNCLALLAPARKGRR